jgi:probable HAF family extracellular repeat protein
MHRALLSAVLFLSILVSTFVVAQDASYTFTTIDVPNSIGTATTGINDRGQIVGRFRDAAGETHGLLIDGAELTIIDVPGIRETTEANAINNRGQIVGIFRDATGALHSFLKDRDTFTTFDVPGATFTFATGINDHGWIVGFFGDATGTHGFLTTDGGDTFTIIDVPNAESTGALGINNRGQIVGEFSGPKSDPKYPWLSDRRRRHLHPCRGTRRPVRQSSRDQLGGPDRRNTQGCHRGAAWICA